MSDANAVRKLIELRDQLQAELRGKQHQLEGIDMAIRLVEESEKADG